MVAAVAITASSSKTAYGDGLSASERQRVVDLARGSLRPPDMGAEARKHMKGAIAAVGARRNVSQDL